jgi:predicted DNA-binding transcriptional regulator AlpA
MSKSPTIEWVTCKMFAKLCGVSRQTVYNWKAKGLIPPYRYAGKRPLIHVPSAIQAVKDNGLQVDEGAFAYFLGEHDNAVHPLDSQFCRGIVDQLTASKSK